ncbi:carbohydrate esterase family 4 protein [Mycena floridula]|nr:carbohydrate esterase family 4 protein [Mycena floridula]
MLKAIIRQLEIPALYAEYAGISPMLLGDLRKPFSLPRPPLVEQSHFVAFPPIMRSNLSLLLALCVGGFVVAVPQRRQSLAQVVTSCVLPKTAALTFDDGPWIYNKDVVDTLVANNATGTFFFNGDNYDCIYSSDAMARIKYVYAHGHQVGSHTWAHLDLTTLSWDNIHDQMWKVELALTRIIGVVPAFMRPRKFLRSSLDSDGDTVAQSETLYDQLIASHPNNVVALNHETEEGTAHRLLPYAISKLKAAGYKLVSLSECTGLPAYQSVGTPGTPDSTWIC